MLVRFGYDIAFRLPSRAAVLYVLRVHDSRSADLVRPESFRVEPALPFDEYLDKFGNLCGRTCLTLSNTW
jgi:hypothetical protein